MERKLGLALEDRRRRVGQHHGVAVADDAAGGLVEGVDRRGFRARAVLHVIDRHAVDVDGARQRRPDADAADRHAIARRGGFFEGAPELRVPLNDAPDEVLRMGMRDILRDRGHVHHRVPLQHAKPEIIEKQQLHMRLALMSWAVSLNLAGNAIVRRAAAAGATIWSCCAKG
jgi:hypothetical protein